MDKNLFNVTFPFSKKMPYVKSTERVETQYRQDEKRNVKQPPLLLKKINLNDMFYNFIQASPLMS